MKISFTILLCSLGSSLTVAHDAQQANVGASTICEPISSLSTAITTDGIVSAAAATPILNTTSVAYIKRQKPCKAASGSNTTDSLTTTLTVASTAHNTIIIETVTQTSIIHVSPSSYSTTSITKTGPGTLPTPTLGDVPSITKSTAISVTGPGESMLTAASTASMSSSAAAASAMNTTASTSPAVNLSLQNGAGGSMSGYFGLGMVCFSVAIFCLI